MDLNSVNSIANDNSALSALVLHWPPSLRLPDEQFFEFCRANKELRIERSTSGDYQIMAPTGGQTGCLNLRIAAQLYNWAEQDGRGVAFDSSTGFRFPNGAIRSPDVSWVKKSRLAGLTPEQKRKFLPLCPDFVIELRSPSDHLQILQDKMQEYVENGVGLGWVIDPENRQVYAFPAGGAAFCMENPVLLPGGDVLQGFEMDMAKIWNVEF